MPRAACATSWRQRRNKRPRKDRTSAACDCWRGPQCCADALPTCLIRTDCCLRTCQVARPRAARAACRSPGLLAICRRLVAVHCLYGVDSNRLAIELAKVSLWLESYAEGLPLTFLDHRLVQGDSVLGRSSRP